MIKINVISNNILWNKFLKNPCNYINKKIKKLNLKNKKFLKKHIYCSLLLSGDKEIKLLNKKFRNKNKSTDVLSFPFHEKRNLSKILKKEKDIYLGDIIINFNKIKNKESLKNFKLAFDNLWVHGLVHLFGYDHKNKKDFIKMQKIESKFLKFIND